MAISPTSMANMAFWNSLPMGMTNFGGDIQVFPIDTSLSAPVGMIYNSQATAQLSQPTFDWGMPSCPIVDNFKTQEKALETNMYGQFAKERAASASSNISVCRNKLTSMLQTEGITAEEKAKINAVLEKLDALEKKIAGIIDSQDSNQDKYKKMCELGKEINQTLIEAAQMKLASQNSNTNTDNTNTDNTNTGNTNTDNTNTDNTNTDNTNTDNTNTDNTNTDNTNTDNTENSNQDGTVDLDAFADDRGVLALADKFNEAVNDTCCGISCTDDGKFNEVCEAITPENVVPLLLSYNKFHSAENGESFMEAFMYDADHEQKAKYGKHIADCLRTMAIAIGVYDDCSDDFTAIYKELDDVFISNDIAKNFDNILEKIAKAYGGSKYATKKEVKSSNEQEKDNK